jgi:hypothetical protein
MVVTTVAAGSSLGKVKGKSKSVEAEECVYVDSDTEGGRGGVTVAVATAVASSSKDGMLLENRRAHANSLRLSVRVFDCNGRGGRTTSTVIYV